MQRYLEKRKQIWFLKRLRVAAVAIEIKEAEHIFSQEQFTILSFFFFSRFMRLGFSSSRSRWFCLT